MDLIALFLPPLLLSILFLYIKFKFKPDNWSNIFKAIVLGLLAVVILVLTDYIFFAYWHDKLHNMRRMAAYVFVGIAFSSEFAKFLVLRYGFVKKGLIKTPLEGIIYALFVGISFAIIASLLYYYKWIGTDRFYHFTLYLWSYPFASIIFSIIMGFFIGMAETRKNALIDNLVGLFLATFFHATFYFCFVSSDLRLFGFTVIGFLFIGSGLLIKSTNFEN